MSAVVLNTPQQQRSPLLPWQQDDSTLSGLVADIKGRWEDRQIHQEEHEITNWLKRSGWTAHFLEWDLGDIYGVQLWPNAWPGTSSAARAGHGHRSDAYSSTAAYQGSRACLP